MFPLMRKRGWVGDETGSLWRARGMDTTPLGCFDFLLTEEEDLLLKVKWGGLGRKFSKSCCQEGRQKPLEKNERRGSSEGAFCVFCGP